MVVKKGGGRIRTSMGIIKTFEGLNSEHLLGKKRRKIKKYSDDMGNHYIVIDGEDFVTVEFKDKKICEQGEIIDFINSKKIKLSEFNLLLA